MKRLKSELDSNEYAKLEGMMWILRKQHECLSDADKLKLKLLYKYSYELKKAHRYALKLTSIFNTHCGRKSGMAKLNRWIKKVEKSAVTCSDGFISTLGKYKSYIVNYFKKRKNSGFVEGINNTDSIFFDRHAGHKIEYSKETYHIIKNKDVVVVL